MSKYEMSCADKATLLPAAQKKNQFGFAQAVVREADKVLHCVENARAPLNVDYFLCEQDMLTPHIFTDFVDEAKLEEIAGSDEDAYEYDWCSEFAIRVLKARNPQKYMIIIVALERYLTEGV